MNPADDAHGEHRMELEAAEWVVRRDAGLSPAQQDEFLRWLAADPRHREVLARYGGVWKDFGLLAQWSPEHGSEPNPDLLARPATQRGYRAWLAAALAAAALVALALNFWHRLPEAIAGRPAAALSSVISAPDGYVSRVLDDGSVVSLNRGAVLKVLFTPAERSVELVHGEVHFQVAKNPRRPFVVRAAGVDVRAVGTAFDVTLGERAVEVLVTEGRVQVRRTFGGAGDSLAFIPALDRGERAVVPISPSRGAPQISRVSSAESDRLLAWRPRLLDFDPAPLSEVVAQFNRCNRVQITIADPALESVEIVASLRSDNVDGFVRLLELTAGVRAERTGDNRIVLRRAP